MNDFRLLSTPDSITEIRNSMRRRIKRSDHRKNFFRVALAIVVGISPFFPFVSFAGYAPKILFDVHRLASYVLFVSAVACIVSAVAWKGRFLWIPAACAFLSLAASMVRIWFYTQAIMGKPTLGVMKYVGLPLFARGVVDYKYGFYVVLLCAILLLTLSAKDKAKKENLLD